MFARWMVWLGVVATLVYVGVGAIGYFGDRGVELQQAHLTGGLLASMMLLFVHVWMTIYLWGGRKIVAGSPSGDRSRWRNGAAWAFSLALLSVVNFGFGLFDLSGDLAQEFHRVLVWVFLLLQGIGLVVENGAISDLQQRLEDARGVAAREVGS